MSDNTNFTTEEIDETSKTFRDFISFFRDLVIILIIVIITRVFIMTPFRINGSSMEASYHDKEFILVDKFSYLNFPENYAPKSTITDTLTTTLYSILSKLPIHVGDPERGDVVVITPHVDKNREYYIKRVIGLPGETIKFASGQVWIKKVWEEKFVQLDESYLGNNNRGQTYLPEYVESREFVVPASSYWVMGDNRNNSSDSRSCFRNCFGSSVGAHYIKRSDIIGVILLDFGYINIFSEGWLLDKKVFHWTSPPRLLDHPRQHIYTELE
jgi:signal peptidase I